MKLLSVEAQGAEPLLQELHGAVKKRESLKGQIHRVFENSFDVKECFSLEFIEQKLTYIHHNPVRGKWNFIADFALYPHSSAWFYFGKDANVFKNIMKGGRSRCGVEVPGSRHDTRTQSHLRRPRADRKAKCSY